MSDLDKKTLRHFYCRDTLWQAFERLSDTLDRGMDDLINEAMGLYLREQGDAATPAPQPGGRMTAPLGAQAPALTAPGRPGVPRPAAPDPPPRQPAPSVPPPLPPPRASMARPAVAPPRPVAPSQPPLPSADAEVPAPPLYLIFDNRKYRIDKEQFIIGRGVKSSDLPIRDGNISRKHAAVIRRNGAYFIKDLGSTNGIDFNGNRIDNKRIEEGDVFFLCEYQLRFTYQ